VIGVGQASPRDGAATGRPAARMRFSVDGWDPAYGTSVDLEDYLG